jgi:hypothetical protein
MNNIFYNSINGVSNNSINQLTMDYNMYFNQWRNWYMIGWIDLEAYRQQHPELEQHSRYVNVSFASYSYPNPDLSLVPNSAAIDSGVALQDLQGITFMQDKEGNARPSGTAWDIGAYEYTGDNSMMLGDVNLDGRVDILDIQAIVFDFGKTSSYNPNVDLNQDQTINLFDVMIVVKNWERTQ